MKIFLAKDEHLPLWADNTNCSCMVLALPGTGYRARQSNGSCRELAVAPRVPYCGHLDGRGQHQHPWVKSARRIPLLSLQTFRMIHGNTAVAVGGGIVCSFNAVMFLKLWSFVHVCFWAREKQRHVRKGESGKALFLVNVLSSCMHAATQRRGSKRKGNSENRPILTPSLKLRSNFGGRECSSLFVRLSEHFPKSDRSPNLKRPQTSLGDLDHRPVAANAT